MDIYILTSLPPDPIVGPLSSRNPESRMKYMATPCNDADHLPHYVSEDLQSTVSVVSLVLVAQHQARLRENRGLAEG